ncbi:MAG: glycerate kinase [Burkholderiaceae bacterium]|nr:glycerate kinase [Burkholderiaceae bacterium]
MNLRKIFVPLGAIALVVFGYTSYGWPGVAAAGGGLLMWALLHFTRLMNVLKKAADRPVGYVGSAVMLNAKLRPGVNLLHVVAMTRSLGQQLSPVDEQPEIFRWTDGSHSHVSCEFRGGKLVKWELVRPTPPQDTPESASTTPTP